jgi:YihY family inner membrane protein
MRQKIKTITDFFSISLSRFTAARSSLHAAGLTYFTMMSLIPVLCLLLLLARTLGMGEIARNEINRQIDVLITNVEKGQDKDIGVIPLSEEVKKAKKEQAQIFAAEARKISNELFDRINNFNVGTLGWMGLAMLLWTAVSTLGTVETAFNEIWMIKKARPVWKRFLLYGFISTILPLIIALSVSMPVLQVVKNILSTVFGVTSITKYAGEALINLLDSTVFSIAVSSFFAIMAFTLFLYIMPNRKVSFLSALCSGMATAALFGCWIKICAVAQVGIANSNALYGSFAFLPIVLAWAYMSWQIVLIGGSMTYAFENLHKKDCIIPAA